MIRLLEFLEVFIKKEAGLSVASQFRQFRLICNEDRHVECEFNKGQDSASCGMGETGEA
ncbi:MAG: hypothetical protein NPIRA04_28320 [Nitrospirales bacterium]|nr:MAG: hypothetical protein NPIRA04_28320 [Nitrospirales bacterium]